MKRPCTFVSQQRGEFFRELIERLEGVWPHQYLPTSVGNGSAGYTIQVNETVTQSGIVSLPVMYFWKVPSADASKDGINFFKYFKYNTSGCECMHCIVGIYKVGHWFLLEVC